MGPPQIDAVLGLLYHSTKNGLCPYFLDYFLLFWKNESSKLLRALNSIQIEEPIEGGGQSVIFSEYDVFLPCPLFDLNRKPFPSSTSMWPYKVGNKNVDIYL